ncbi:MAG: 4'-phosphopantetheinyl transferase superfamily protein [Acidobacteriia bacterium]|nr:4'-phosphopantetheinyl transferase superfamily protein [Terriglobia bacterium]
MMDVYWLEQTEEDVPRENDWLSQTEALQQSGMRFAKRRADWRLGRWTAKRAVAACLNLPGHAPALAEIEIRPAPSGAPEVFLANQPAAVTISLSHRAGAAICAVALPGVELGCDLEMIEPRSDAFVADYFTSEEQALVAQASAADRSRLLALLWSGKESALKALRAGLGLDTRCVMVCPEGACQGGDEAGCIEDPTLGVQSSHGPGSWRPLQVHYAGSRVFHGWWQCTGNLLRTVVATPPPVPPILLKIPTGHVAMPLP